MVDRKRMEALLERLVELAESDPPAEARESLNEMLEALNLPGSRTEDLRSLALSLTQSGNLAQHIENLSLYGIELPKRPASIPNLVDMRTALSL